MSLNSLYNQSINNNKVANANLGQISKVKSVSSSSIFASAGTANAKSSASIFGGASNFAKANSLTSTSFEKQAPAAKAENSNGFLNQIKSFFTVSNKATTQQQEKPEENGDIMSRAAAVLAQAQQASSSPQAQELLAKADKLNTEKDEPQKTQANKQAAQKQNTQKAESKQSEQPEENKDNNKVDDYSKATKEQLQRAISAGKPQDEMTAMQMLNNPNLAKEDLVQIKDRFKNNPNVNEAVQGLEDNFS